MQNVTLKTYKKELFMDAEIFKGLTRGNHHQKIGVHDWFTKGFEKGHQRVKWFT